MTHVLLCCDLDRTILPNGPEPESAEARARLRRLAAHPELTLVYVSGRHKALLLEAIAEYDIPVPRFAIGDVGTTIYQIEGENWHRWARWDAAIAPDWRGLGRERLAGLLAGIEGLRPQEPEKQNTFKLSYYAPADIDRARLFAAVDARLTPQQIRANLIWSVDDLTHEGLLDVLPRSANKLHAIRFLMQERSFDETHTVFAGDSGNDLPVLTSGLQAVLVNNARPEVKEEALREVAAGGREHTLYLAHGDFLGMNGNYAGGVLEGLAHFIPQTRAWMLAAGEESGD